MQNHFHIVAHVPCQAPSHKKAAKRYNRYYGGTRKIEPGTTECERIAQQMRDISCFMRDLQQHFSCWFNRTRKERRRGTLWQGRFASSILEGGSELYILDVLAKSKSHYDHKSRRLTRMLTASTKQPSAPIYAFKQLRVRLE